MDIWGICETIAGKNNWYQKVFDDVIVNKWKLEIKSDDNFDLALRLLQASAKGSCILKDCNWGEGLCDDCIKDLKEDMLDNPEDFDYDIPGLAILFTEPNWWYDIAYELDRECEHVKCKCISPHSLLEDYIKYYPDGLLTQELNDECKRLISEISKNEEIDWHPGSNQQVRDIIHPSMYCYVKGISKHKDNTISDICEKNKKYQ